MEKNEKFNFDKLIDRKNTTCLKWDRMAEFLHTKDDPDLLPFWIADMDFQSPPCVGRALQKIIDQNVFGYCEVPSSTKKSIVQWCFEKHQWKAVEETLCFYAGVVTALYTAVRAFSSEGDKVILFVVLTCSAIKDSKRILVDSPLRYVPKENNQSTYEIDFDDFEKKASECKLFLLCNPHNPGGRVWTTEELKKMAEICMKYKVYIVSDDIHCDLVLPHHKTPYIPLPNVCPEAEYTVLHSASKTFNLAGMKASFSLSKTKEQAQKMFDSHLVAGNWFPSILGLVALDTAFSEPEAWEWKCQLLEYLENNLKILIDYLNEHLPQLRIMIPQATYLVWIDFSQTNLSKEEIHKKLFEEAKIALDHGEKFGDSRFWRFNIACPKELMMKGLVRLVAAFKNKSG